LGRPRLAHRIDDGLPAAPVPVREAAQKADPLLLREQLGALLDDLRGNRRALSETLGGPIGKREDDLVVGPKERKEKRDIVNLGESDEPPALAERRTPLAVAPCLGAAGPAPAQCVATGDEHAADGRSLVAAPTVAETARTVTIPQRFLPAVGRRS